MTSDRFLFLFIISLLGLTAYLSLTSDVSDEERDEMLNDEELWP